ncbi:MAG: hypothetical protein F4X34_02675 [Chloroflexi bacterium]|nr:hypothetical protein [Chloroflexota bacterium]
MVVGVATGAGVGEGEVTVVGLARAGVSGAGMTVGAGLVGVAAMVVDSVVGPSGAHAVNNTANRSSSPSLFMAPSFLLVSDVVPSPQASLATKCRATTLARSE